MKTKIWKFCAVGTSIGMAALAGCGGQSADNSATSTDTNAAPSAATPTAPTGATTGLTGAGATFPAPIYSKWFTAYQAAKGVQVNYQAIGSGGGIQQLKNKTFDFGASDVALSDKDIAGMPSPVVHIPTVAGAVAVIYNLPGVNSSLNLTGDVLADIFIGTITKWNDPKIAALNPTAKLPATSITIAHRADGSGTTNIFTTYLKAVSPAWATKVGAGKSVSWPVGQGGKGSDGVASIVKQTPGGIGYAELAYALQNKLSVVSVKNKAGKFVAPSVDATTAAAEGSLDAIKKDVRAPIVNSPGDTAYPIAGFTYVLIYKKQADPAKGKALTALLGWAIHDGQSMAAPLYYAPLPAEVVAIDEAALKGVS